VWSSGFEYQTEENVNWKKINIEVIDLGSSKPTVNSGTLDRGFTACTYSWSVQFSKTLGTYI
jgi:hypothetical protein